MARKNPSAKGPKRKSRFDRIVLWGIVVSLVAIALLLWGPFSRHRTARQAAPPKKQETASREPRRSADRTDRKHPAEISGVVAVVIDDLGQDLKPAQQIMALPDRVTLAVMPLLPHSKRIAELARQQGHEVIVHLPMEPKGRGDKRPAAGMLRTNMTPLDFIAQVNEDLDSVPGAAGINNHEGSALTENRQAMTFLMSALKDRGLFLLDSLTDPKSQAFAVAKEFGLRAAKRDVFLDHESSDPLVIRRQLEELARIARERGQAIGIGHPHPATIEELRKWLPEAAQQGIEVVPLSRLVQ
jgi:uncharacterized protein